MSKNNTETAEFLVIGAGPGGYAAAFLASDLGMDVTLIDPKENPGGVCLYSGCIPTKALLHVVKLKNDLENAEKMGISYENLGIDIDKLRDFENSVVKKLTGGLGQLTKRRKIRYIQGKARFSGKTEVIVTPPEGEEFSLSFTKAVIATGTRAASIPGVELDGKKIMYAKTALDIEEIPKRLLVVGAGYIGLELASLYSRLGSEVTIAEMLPEIMPGADRDLIKIFLKENSKTFKEILTETMVASIEDEGDVQTVRFKNAGDAPDNNEEERTESFEKVLMTVGRTPNTDDLGLQEAGIETDEKGFIPVDERRLTDNKDIFAIGDITGPPLLAHKAHAEGRVAAAVAAGEKEIYDPAVIPSVEYTDPEIAWVGLTERDAEERGIDITTAAFPWGASGRAATLGLDSGKTKMIIDAETERILGVGIVGGHADELIPEAALAIEMAALASDVAKTIHPHPTLSETLMEAAESFYGTATDIFAPKKKM